MFSLCTIVLLSVTLVSLLHTAVGTATFEIADPSGTNEFVPENYIDRFNEWILKNTLDDKGECPTFNLEKLRVKASAQELAKRYKPIARAHSGKRIYHLAGATIIFLSKRESSSTVFYEFTQGHWNKFFEEQFPIVDLGKLKIKRKEIFGVWIEGANEVRGHIFLPNCSHNTYLVIVILRENRFLDEICPEIDLKTNMTLFEAALKCTIDNTGKGLYELRSKPYGAPYSAYLIPGPTTVQETTGKKKKKGKGKNHHDLGPNISENELGLTDSHIQQIYAWMTENGVKEIMEKPAQSPPTAGGLTKWLKQRKARSDDRNLSTQESTKPELCHSFTYWIIEDTSDVLFLVFTNNGVDDLYEYRPVNLSILGDAESGSTTELTHYTFFELCLQETPVSPRSNTSFDKPTPQFVSKNDEGTTKADPSTARSNPTKVMEALDVSVGLKILGKLILQSEIGNSDSSRSFPLISDTGFAQDAATDLRETALEMAIEIRTGNSTQVNSTAEIIGRATAAWEDCHFPWLSAILVSAVVLNKNGQNEYDKWSNFLLSQFSDDKFTKISRKEILDAGIVGWNEPIDIISNRQKFYAVIVIVKECKFLRMINTRYPGIFISKSDTAKSIKCTLQYSKLTDISEELEESFGYGLDFSVYKFPLQDGLNLDENICKHVKEISGNGVDILSIPNRPLKSAPHDKNLVDLKKRWTAYNFAAWASSTHGFLVIYFKTGNQGNCKLETLMAAMTHPTDSTLNSFSKQTTSGGSLQAPVVGHINSAVDTPNRSTNKITSEGSTLAKTGTNPNSVPVEASLKGSIHPLRQSSETDYAENKLPSHAIRGDRSMVSSDASNLKLSAENLAPVQVKDPTSNTVKPIIVKGNASTSDLNSLDNAQNQSPSRNASSSSHSTTSSTANNLTSNTAMSPPNTINSTGSTPGRSEQEHTPKTNPPTPRSRETQETVGTPSPQPSLIISHGAPTPTRATNTLNSTVKPSRNEVGSGFSPASSTPTPVGPTSVLQKPAPAQVPSAVAPNTPVTPLRKASSLQRIAPNSGGNSSTPTLVRKSKSQEFTSKTTSTLREMLSDEKTVADVITDLRRDKYTAEATMHYSSVQLGSNSVEKGIATQKLKELLINCESEKFAEVHSVNEGDATFSVWTFVYDNTKQLPGSTYLRLSIKDRVKKELKSMGHVSDVNCPKAKFYKLLLTYNLKHCGITVMANGDYIGISLALTPIKQSS